MQACHCFPFNTIYAATMLNTRKQNVNRRVFFSLSAQKSCAKKDRTCTCDFLFCNWLHGNLHKSGPSISDYRTNFRNWKDLQRSRRKTRRTKTRPWKRGHFRVDFWRVFGLPRESPSEEFQFELLHFGFLVEFLIRISAFGRPIPFFCAKNSKMFQRIRALPEFLANFGILRWIKGIGRPSAEIRIKNSEFFFPKKEFGGCWS